ncbi:DUF6326 family protein [Cytobacillus sp. Hm23]
MHTEKKIIDLNRKTTLSALWIFVLLNVVFRDIHELFRPGLLQEMMTGNVNGTLITEELLLVFGILLEIPIAMVILSRILQYRINRLINIMASFITMIMLIFFGGINDLDDIFFLTMEIIALIAIIWCTWRWPNPNPNPNPSK